MPILVFIKILIAKFIFRNKLNLNGHKISEFPRSLLSLRGLEELWVSHTQVSDLSPLAQLQNLTRLYVFNTQVSDLSPLAQLQNLTRLYVFDTQVSDLSPLAQLQNLEDLWVSNTQVSDLSSLVQLQNLITLNVSNTQVSDLTPLAQLQNLTKLDVYNTQVSDLSSLAQLQNLTMLDVSYTQVSDLSPLVQLQNLTSLDISNTQVSDLSSLVQLQNLITLNVSNTQVSDLTPLRSIIEKGAKIKWKRDYEEGIYVEGCSIINPPKAIIEQGKKAVLLYWEQIQEQEGSVELYEAKLIIVGEGGTGKTTLFEKLKDADHQVGGTLETHGINIYDGLPFAHHLIEHNTFYANLWDFGGQDLQYMTHQFFLTPNALYVLMMDARRESPNLPYWFKIISLLGKDDSNSKEKVKLLLVFNKRGNSTGQPQYQDQLKYYEDSLDVQFLEVDFAENDYRFENLLNAIQRGLVTLPIIKSQLPKMWTKVRQELRIEAEQEKYITTKRFSEICSRYEIGEEEDQWLLSGYLHVLGSLLHFQNDRGLRSIIILNPQWAVDGIYSFLKEESIIRRHGQFTEDEFISLLKQKGYKREDIEVILQLMTKNNLDICYESSPRNYIATQLLPDNAPEYSWFPKGPTLQFRYQYPIMPKGLISRLIVRLSEFIDRIPKTEQQIVWKKGAVLRFKLKEGTCRVRMREDDAESNAGLRQITIEVIGDRKALKFALHRVRDTVEDLHKKWFRNIKADEMVPCCCKECVVSDYPFLYKLDNLLKKQTKRKDTSCDFSGDDVMIQSLLEGVYDESEIQEMTSPWGEKPDFKMPHERDKFHNR